MIPLFMVVDTEAQDVLRLLQAQWVGNWGLKIGTPDCRHGGLRR